MTRPRRVVVALGGNALVRPGEALTVEGQRAAVRGACRALAEVARDHALVVTHGSGPQVGFLAARAGVGGEPLDVLDAETEGFVGYLVEQELAAALGPDRAVATLLTMVEVDAGDPAFRDPTKPVGARMPAGEADRARVERGWTFRPDGDGFRRVVASPRPRAVVEARPLRWLLERGCVVVCAGGGGIPVVRAPGGRLVGVEGVVDKDRASALVARAVGADLLVLATDVDAVHLDWGSPGARRVRAAHPEALGVLPFDPGSMGPKVEAACDVAAAGAQAVIGSLDAIVDLVALRAGTLVSTSVEGIDAPAVAG